jgi:hypothetical protein
MTVTLSARPLTALTGGTLPPAGPPPLLNT